jgi:hypothetical protein
MDQLWNDYQAAVEAAEDASWRLKAAEQDLDLAVKFRDDLEAKWLAKKQHKTHPSQ